MGGKGGGGGRGGEMNQALYAHMNNKRKMKKKKKKQKMDWRCSSSSRVPALQAQSPELNLVPPKLFLKVKVKCFDRMLN
jgi:hypothetical protein